MTPSIIEGYHLGFYLTFYLTPYAYVYDSLLSWQTPLPKNKKARTKNKKQNKTKSPPAIGLKIREYSWKTIFSKFPPLDAMKDASKKSLLCRGQQEG